MKQIVTLLLLFTAIIKPQSTSSKQIVDLRGNWKFEIGDDKKYAEPNFNDKQWGEIFVPADWENEGYPGYDGYAWYRRTFTVPASAQNKNIYAHIGYVDDVCAVYINGNIIGEGGSFPPDFQTAYEQEQQFLIPGKFLRFNQENVIAVRVFDSHLNGGIVKGKIGIFEHSDPMQFVVRLPDQWKFKRGDNEEWKKPNVDDSKWQELIVPAQWDFQGYRKYDGFGWYRVTFEIPANIQKEDLVLMLGKIDDVDEAYLNGERIGYTGRIKSDGTVGKIREEYQEIRAYDIPASSIKFDNKNVLAVRVFDDMLIGGIYEGPIGITTEKEYRKWNRNKPRKYQNDENNFDRFLQKLFDE
ncbi:MAG TPA: glycoside hydrolase [Bacteroidetes bacterium]|nr:glycoside hydrolase [Bacteroidota bacterium]